MMKAIRFFVLFLILILGQAQAFAFFNMSSDIEEEVIAKNAPRKVYRQNMQSFGCFLDAQCEFPTEARFVTPVLTENPRKNLRLLATSLYFNILKNEKLLELQKEKITATKELFDTYKNYGNQKKTAELTEAYTQAQIEYLAYKKAAQMCKKQLKNLGAKETNTDQDIDKFDLSTTIELAAKPNLSREEDDIAEHFKYEYTKAENLECRIKKQSQLVFPKDAISQLQAKYDMIELKKALAITKLRCIIYYFSLKEALY